MKELSWGVLGASFFAIEHMIPALQQTAGLRVHGIASRELAKAEAVAEQFGLAQAYGDYDSMLADPAIDVVFNPPAQPPPRALDGEGGARRQARALREAHRARRGRGGAAHRRPRRDRRADPGGLRRHPSPAMEAGAGAGARGPHRPPAGDPGLVQLLAGRPREHPQQAGDGRRRAARRRSLSAAPPGATSSRPTRSAPSPRSSGIPNGTWTC